MGVSLGGPTAMTLVLDFLRSAPGNVLEVLS